MADVGDDVSDMV